jgi:hypothetical protein
MAVTDPTAAVATSRVANRNARGRERLPAHMYWLTLRRLNAAVARTSFGKAGRR